MRSRGPEFSWLAGTIYERAAMKAAHLALLLSLGLGSTPFLAGCDKTVEEKTTETKTKDGETKDVKKETVSSDGTTVTKTEQHTATPPAAPNGTETKDTSKTTVSGDGKTVTKTEQHTDKP